MPRGDVKQYKQHLLQAAAKNQAGALRPLLEEGGVKWEEIRNDDKQNVLQISAMEGAEDCVALLLRYPRVTSLIDSRDHAHRTALHLAAAMGFDSVVSRLIAAKATIDIQDSKGCTPLLLAVRFDWIDAARTLLNASANPMLTDSTGASAVDAAFRKPDGESAQLLSAFAGHRKQGGPLYGLQRCIFPRWGAQPQQPPEHSPAASKPSKDWVGGVGQSGGPDPARIGSRTSKREKGSLHTAIDEACDGAGKDNEDEVIEWDGLKPVLVSRSPEGSPIVGKAMGDSRPGRAPSASPGSTSVASSSGWWRQGADAERQAGAGKQQAGAASASRGSAGSSAGPEFAVFRLQLFFDETVKRLEFEVEWLETNPAAGAVKPGGEADCRGLLHGDNIVEIGGVKTYGKGRDELLPVLKGRPLVMKVEREVQVRNAQDPHIELTLRMSSGSNFSDHGVDIMTLGQLCTVSAVRPQSRCWAAGVLEGDAIVRIGSKAATKLSNSAILSALQEQTQSVTVRRRPLGAKLSTPWRLQD